MICAICDSDIFDTNNEIAGVAVCPSCMLRYKKMKESDPAEALQVRELINELKLSGCCRMTPSAASPT